MSRAVKHRLPIAATAALSGLILAGCGSNAQQTGSSMMSGGSNYNNSQPTCTAPATLPGSILTVALADDGMNMQMGGTSPLGARMTLQGTPATVPAGVISFVASNTGWLTHELVVLPLPVGTAAGQRVPQPDGKVNEAGSLGESSRTCAAGAGDGINAGGVGWTTLTLRTGHYELLCNLPDHYTDGMHQELTVT